MKNWTKIVILVGVLLVTELAFGQGCSQCKMVSEQSASGTLDEASFGRNINYGILYLMTIPYILLFFLFRKRIFKFFRSLKAKKSA